MRTRYAISIAALSGALVAPPAISQTSDWRDEGDAFASVETRAEFDLTVLAAFGEDAYSDDNLFAEAELRFELEGLTDDGLRWGGRLGARAQRDQGRRGLAARAGDCPPGPAPNDCPSAGGVAARGAAGGFYTAGAAENYPDRAALDDAHLFLRSGWGEARLGWSQGAAALESLPTAGAFRLARADGGPVDPSGLAGARTLSMASGHAPKLVLTSERFGQSITIGSFGVSASYTPRADHCGVDLCLDPARPGAPAAPRIDQVFEIAGGYERRIGETVWTASLGLARGEAGIAAAEFDALTEATAALGWERGAWRASLHHLQSSNGVSDGDYAATAFALSREDGPWLAAFEWAAFSDDFAHVDGSSLQLGASRLVGDRWVWGAGVSRVEQDAPRLAASGRTSDSRSATVVFTEIGVRF